MPDRIPDPYLPGHGDNTFSVEHYDLDLAYKLAGNFLTGRAQLTLAITEATKRIEIDLHGLRVHNLKVEGAKVERWTHTKGRITLKFKQELAPGTPLVVSIDYRGAPKPVRGIDGEAGWEELDDGVIVASQPHGAPSWFPCNDRSSDKASYRIQVSTDSEYSVIANGQLTAQSASGRNTTWTWEQREPMAPYLATVQIGRYVTSELAGARVPVAVHHPRALGPAVARAFARQGEMVTFFESVFGPYPFGSYSAVVTPDKLDIPLESQSLSTFGANHATTTWEAQRLIAHELSHQWFGNSVTAGLLRDIWLHEGFACYAEWLWSQASGGPSTQERAAEHWAKLQRLPQDLTLVDPGPKLMFDDRVYKRGALTLHALRAEMGSAAFFDLVRAWVEGHRYGVVGTQDFIDLASELAGHDLGPLFAAWLTETSLPALPVFTD